MDIRSSRIAKGYTVSQLAQAAGVPKITLRRLERGITDFSRPTVEQALAGLPVRRPRPFRIPSDVKALVHHSMRRVYDDHIRPLRREGWSQARIAKALASKGIMPPCGKAWRRYTVGRLEQQFSAGE